MTSLLTADKKTAYVPLYGDGIYGRNPNDPAMRLRIVDMDAARSSARSTSPRIAQPTAFRSTRTRNDLRRQRPRSQAARHRSEGAKESRPHAIDTEGTTHWIGICERQQDLRDEQERRPASSASST